MSFLSIFGNKKTPEQMMREYKRTLDKTIRDLERERVKMQAQEKKLLQDMRKMAKQNQMEAVKIMARDLVRTRAYVTKFYQMKAQMQAVSLRLQTMKSTATMTDCMKGVTKAMMGMNRQMNIPAMQRIMMEYEKQSEVMEMKQEIMNDTIDDVMDTEGSEDAEANEMVNQVLDELKLDFNQKIGAADSQLVSQNQGEEQNDDLQARLDKLRKS
jgi:charged multivesicular body protein 2A